MKRILTTTALVLAIHAIFAQGKVGINTTTPQAMLHVKDSNVLFSGVDGSLPAIPGDPPASGAGTRMMWYPDKAAFRAGRVHGNHWDKDSVGDYSFAIGFDAKAKGSFSIAMGSTNTASGFHSIAMGQNTHARGNYSMAIGSGAVTSGSISLAMGVVTKTSGTASMAMGYSTSSAGDYSTAMGEYSTASGRNSTAMGYYTTARAFSSLAIGGYNDSITGSSTFLWTPGDPVFIIGNGIDNDNRSNAFTVLKNAKTGVNIQNGLPQALLHLKAPEASYNMHIRLENYSNSDYSSIIYDGNMKFRTFGTDDAYEWRTADNNARMVLSQTGNLNIDGALTQNSDVRLKKNIQPLQNSLQKILSVNGYYYNWIDQSRGQDLQTGILAQEIEKQMPELVKKDDEGMRSVNYSGIIPYMIEGMKEQQRKIDLLEKELATIKELLLQKNIAR